MRMTRALHLHTTVSRITLEAVKNVVELCLSIAALIAAVGGLPVYKHYKKKRDEERERNARRDAVLDQFAGMEEQITSLVSAVGSMKAEQQKLLASQASVIGKLNHLDLVTSRHTEVSPECFWETDAHGFCTDVNASWEKLFGLTKEQAAANGWRQRIHHEDRDRVMDSWVEAIRYRQQWTETYRVVRQDGKAIQCLARARPYLSHTGELVGYLGTTTVIEEHRP